MDLFLGFECAAVENWKEMLPEIKAPSNYKKEEAIAGFIAKRMAELEKEVPTHPILGVTTKVVALDSENTQVIGAKCDVLTAYTTLSRLLANTPPIRMFGFNIRQRIHQLAVTCALQDDDCSNWGLYAKSYLSTPEEVQRRVSYVDPAKLLTGDSADPLTLLSRTKLGTGLAVEAGAAKEAASVFHVVKCCGLASELF